MEFRTTVKVDPYSIKLSYKEPVMLIGSCFASSIGEKLKLGNIPAMINPSGTVYNPVSVSNTIDIITSGKIFTLEDLYCHNGEWLSFYHHTDFSSDNAEILLEKINERSSAAGSFLQKAGFLFVTFGTARVYRLKETGQIVSNCHKVPQAHFYQELLEPAEIISLWTNQLDKLHSAFPELKVIFTISPVRHWKDGAHGNQVSKSVLFIAIEELLRHKSSPVYFPAYEILMDDLRDYRFYCDDMLHPSSLAVDYIWELFSGAFMDNATIEIWREVCKITKACSHKLLTDSSSKQRQFAETMLQKIFSLSEREKLIDLKAEQKYFADIINNLNV